MTIITVVCLHQKKNLKLKHKYHQQCSLNQVENIRDDLDNASPGGDTEALIKATIEKLKKLENFIRTAADSNEEGAPQVDLQHINESLDNILSKLNKSQVTVRL